MKATVFHQSHHMCESDLHEPAVICPFCASSNRFNIAVLQSDPEVTLQYCDNCHAASASRMPKEGALIRYYESYYCGKEEKITIEAPERIAAHIYHHLQMAKQSFNSAEVSILDYGGGDGTISLGIADFLMKAGKRVTIILVDYDQKLKEVNGSQLCIKRPRDLSEVPDKSVDLVVASAVIEHMPDPRPVLENLFSAMMPGGYFYARTPYVVPLMKIANTLNMEFDFTYPAHVHDLGAKFWNNILNHISSDGEYRIIRSTPSLVETVFSQHFLRTTAAYLLKMPWYLLKENYGMVGGWEIFIRRTA